MQTPVAVVGLWYGDEGKGRVVDWLAGGGDPASTVVIRYNGGAQAGHTAVRGGIRHVFSHFGAGGLVGAATYLASPFICSPVAFLKEAGELKGKMPGGRLSRVIVSPDCRVSIPVDAMLGQAAETARGSGRHGSCGLGINETVERSAVLPLLVRDLLNSRYSIKNYYDRVIQFWLYRRVGTLGLDPKITGDIVSLGYEVFNSWAESVREFRDMVEVAGEGFLAGSEQLIFEGAQGLRLCETNLADFPYLTRSRPGLDNVIGILKTIGVSRLHVVFVSRSYVTRHGPGPLPGERADLSFLDLTNIPDQHRGALRFAEFDATGTLRGRIMREVAKGNRADIKTSWNLAMTCLDQRSEIDIPEWMPPVLGSYGETGDMMWAKRDAPYGLSSIVYGDGAVTHAEFRQAMEREWGFC